MDISTNPKPTIYRNLYEYTGSAVQDTILSYTKLNMMQN